MYKSISGVFENGVLTLSETPPTTNKTKVVVLFLEEMKVPNKRQPGGLTRLHHLKEKQMSLPDDFNEPLDDLKDYL
ncbi:hypothetical protein [Dyadobacter sp. 3J3]|uniref:hypothetical protein n=1 Tax=Dyadobacter sp. 3J3 TaxID=2606600 RepID=UPI001356CB9A|nr:hypothetical protein [Dyadobacter sp. 3J3]